MKSIKIIPTTMAGAVNIPPSKSLCHRAIISAALAKGTSIINNIVLSEDISATIEAVQALGAQVILNDNKLFIKGTDFSVSSTTINCRESGSTLRFIMPLGLLTDHDINYVGSGNLGNRPLDPYIEIFESQSIRYTTPKLPMSVKGRLKPGEFKLRGDISSQFITGLMFALPLLQDDSIINVTTPLESKAYIDLTIDTLKEFGIQIFNDNYKSFFIKGGQCYNPVEYTVEGDYSQAAFWIAAGLLGNRIECKNLNPASKQADKTFIDILKEAGAQIRIESHMIAASKSELISFEADVSQCPDIAPILAVVAAVSSGTSRITGASRLRIKECDRLKAIAAELSKLGADVIEMQDELIIKGKESLKGGVVNSWGDHRLAMALSIASIKCDAPVTIVDSGAVSKSYPDFYEDFTKLGGIINGCDMG